MRLPVLLCLALAAACGGSSNSAPNQYVATLNAAGEVPPVTSGGTGTADLTLSGGRVTYTVTYSGLTGSPTNSHIHVGAAGVAGSVVVQFVGFAGGGTSGSWSGSFGGSDVRAGTNGSTTIIAGDIDSLVDAMRSGNAYVNIHTGTNGGGEIRGQIHPK